jgi:uncharacterized Fe-S cluster-containing radical SAM superfamily protein
LEFRPLIFVFSLLEHSGRPASPFGAGRKRKICPDWEESLLGYDPVAKHRQIEDLVVRKRIGGDQKKYYRFRRDRWYGGIVTADCAGCGLICKFCWVRSQSILEGRAQGEFLTAKETAEKLLHLMEVEKIRQARISGGEPTVGREHLLQLLNLLMNRRVQFILETNGILIGADETYAQDLALFPFHHVRVSLKGSSAKEFEKLTGSEAGGFQLQLDALRNLVKAGVSAHPAVMLSFAGREATDKLYHTIWKIDPRMHSEIEREEVILYPHVSEKLRGANLKPVSGHIPEKRPKAQSAGPKRKS